MTRQEIMDNYAKEQGYKDWKNLSFVVHALVLEEHIDKVIDLIQDELRNNIASIEDISFQSKDKFGNYNWVNGVTVEAILDTPNL
ncbi:hypothetical protein [Chishuiella sp.]|uniref:hypothetical protein n=1 Tax=Chishuiella sp. TaxID=1969467 RepID=UPI0028AF1FB6|nr:hypothetical protein [Chishuiella sp.]